MHPFVDFLKILLGAVLLTVLVGLVVIIIAHIASARPARWIDYYPDRESKIHKQPVDWRGTLFDSKKRFVNTLHPFYQNYVAILIWLPGHLRNLLRQRSLRFPVTYINAADLYAKDGTITWLGHASFFVRVNNINILIDPHFNNTIIYRRHTDNPVNPEHFTNIHYILVSHDHADHCDKASLSLLIKNNPGVKILTGLGMEKLIQSFAAKKVDIHVAEWYEMYAIPGDIEICFVPSRHYSKRVFGNFNSRLWGGFVISYKKANEPGKTIYYGGDSGYGEHFKKTGAVFQPDIAILGIGTYMPGWFMASNHMSPSYAVTAFEDTGAAKVIPMHFGTFNLSNEAMDQPKKTFMALMMAHNGKAIDLGVGDTFTI